MVDQRKEQQDFQIVDGFQIPMKNKADIKLEGSFLQKTELGCFRQSVLILSNQELYIYNDRYDISSKPHNVLIILNPGVFVQTLSSRAIVPDNVKSDEKITKVYPIELYVGGQIGNIGVNDNQHQNGVFTFFFSS